MRHITEQIRQQQELMQRNQEIIDLLRELDAKETADILQEQQEAEAKELRRLHRVAACMQLAYEDTE